MKTYVIGRSAFADIVLPDTSVAPRHAELVRTRDGRFYLTDCCSEGGTWRRDPDGAGDGDWQPLRQAFVDLEETLRFGEQVSRLSDLLADRLEVPLPEGVAADAGGNWPGGGAASSSKPRPRGRVERDPLSGEIVHKRV